MSRYTDLYNSKRITVQEAVGMVKSGDVLAFGMCATEPFSFLTALEYLKGKVENVQLYSSLTLGKYKWMLDPSFAGTFKNDANFFSPVNRAAHKTGMTYPYPGHLHNNISRWLSGHHLNIYVVATTPMDEHGYVRHALSCVADKELLEAADMVICEINPNMPVVGGNTELHISDVDYVYEVNTPVPLLPRGPLGEIEKKIGENVASLVQDGDTIQLGIGSIPDAVAAAFMDKKDLGVHTEMITSSIADLVEAGVVTGKKKSLHKGKIVGAFAWGDQKLYDMMHNNPAVMLMEGNYVNDPYVVAQNDNMVSINTGLAVDLTGQVCSESVGSLQYSGSGGQNDTAEGAIHAKNGRSIIALKATAKNDEISTISAVLPLGSIVTLSRNNIDYVVTEYGVAPLRSCNVKERVDNLIAVAHPKFRDQLREDAKKYGLIL